MSALPVAEAFRIDRAIRHGWAGLRRQPVGLAIGAFLTMMTEGGGGGGGNWTPSEGGGGGGGPNLEDVPDEIAALGLGILLVAAACALLCIAAVWVFRSWILVGYLRLQRDVVVLGEGTVGTVFGGGDALWPMALWSLLAAVVAIGTAIAAAVPGVAVGFALLKLWGVEETVAIAAGVGVGLVVLVPTIAYVSLGLAFGAPAVALDGLAPMEALDRSWTLAGGNRLHLLLFFAVTWLFYLLGVLACCVGVIVTRPIRDVGCTEGYLLATRDDWEEFVLTKEAG